ncbi:Gfo/Idh/MocA family protein [Leifsonia sp. L25]|uniref:Gfo/Idh/MocA family protein n=1 Tax=Leifsonia sp. L25 TaxID=3423957 RepID=UPI003D693EDF
MEFVADLDELLARPELDAVTITTATDQHRDVIGRAIAAGKHVFTEKILAPTVAEAEELVELAREAGVALVVSLPRLYDDYTVAIERILDEGTLGELTYSRVRLAHDGWVAGWLPEQFADPQAAIGGALTDLGCHPAYLTRLFHRADPVATLGELRQRHHGSRGRGQRGGHRRVPRRPPRRLRGERGDHARSLHRGAPRHRGLPHVRLRRRALARQGRRVRRRVAGDPLPERRPGAFAQWVEHIHDGSTADENLRHAVELTRMVVASNESAASGHIVDLAPASASVA